MCLALKKSYMRKNRGNIFFYQYILYLCSTILTLIDMKPKLSQLFNKHSARDIFSAASVFASVSESVLMFNENNVTANPDNIDWEAEKQDILERAKWLVKTIVVDDPETLVNKAPSMIGREYQGEWAIYCCSMLSHALANISYLYPDK